MKGKLQYRACTRSVTSFFLRDYAAASHSILVMRHGIEIAPVL